MKLSLALLAPCISLLINGCATTSDGTKTGADIAVAPPIEAIDGTLRSDAPLFLTAREKAPLCTAAPGAVQILHFAAGRYNVQLPAGTTCAPASVNAQSGWVDARFVDYADEALAPPLTRVQERAGLRVDMAYAGNKIFCDVDRCKINEPLYGKGRCYVRPEVATQLDAAVQALLARDASLRLVVLDCYRPIDVQVEMFKRVNDPIWVAQPKPPRYGGHNRGVAIDLTIERNGKALDMGSTFDAFSHVSNYDAAKVNTIAHANRTLLRDVMVAAGFRPYDAEWWHFSLPVESRAMNFPL
jgi:zinc D-Ala-D-Ala dipeptidase